MIEGILTASINSFHFIFSMFSTSTNNHNWTFTFVDQLSSFLMLRGFGAIRAGGAVSTGVFVVSFTLFVNRLFGRIKTATPFSHKLYE